MQFQTAYSDKPRIQTVNNEPTMTKQNMADDLNVNKIIKKYNKTGVLQNAHNYEGVYGEFTSYDLREAIEKVQKADELFMQVPSNIRLQFNNDAGAFIDFATNQANLKQLRDWGLAHPEKEPVIPEKPA